MEFSKNGEIPIGIPLILPIGRPVQSNHPKALISLSSATLSFMGQCFIQILQAPYLQPSFSSVKMGKVERFLHPLQFSFSCLFLILCLVIYKISLTISAILTSYLENQKPCFCTMQNMTPLTCVRSLPGEIDPLIRTCYIYFHNYTLIRNSF